MKRNQGLVFSQHKESFHSVNSTSSFIYFTTFACEIMVDFKASAACNSMFFPLLF